MRNFTIFKIIFFVLFSLSITTSAQIVISTPNLGFSQACASPSFNTYNVTFSFTPETALVSSNQFSLELSDAEVHMLKYIFSQINNFKKKLSFDFTGTA